MRKATALLVVAFLMVVALPLLSHPRDRAGAAALAVTGRYVATPPQIDGNLAEWPAPPVLVLDMRTAGSAGGAIADHNDLSAAVVIVWDDTYLYMGAIITDSAIVADSSNVWDDDGIEIALDGNADSLCCSPFDHTYTVVADGRLADFGTLSEAGPLRPMVSVRQDGTRYVVEMAVPLVVVSPGAAVSGTIMGLNIGLNDDDDGGRRDKRLVWAGNSTLTFAQFGTLTLVGARQATPVPTATSTASATPTPRPPATATATPTGSLAERVAAMESNMASLEGRIRTMLDILQRVGRSSGEQAPPVQSVSPTVVTQGFIPGYFQAVNAGGPAYTTEGGYLYAADRAYVPGSWGYIGGQTFQTNSTITRTRDIPLYQSQRYQLSGYAFDVPAGEYEIELGFAEIYHYATPGSRVFSVQIEGTTVITDLDVVSRAGLFTALVITRTAVVTDGQLNISFVPKAGAASVNALSVRGQRAAAPTPTPSLTDRVGNMTAKITELEGIVGVIADIVRSLLPATPTVTVTPTMTATATAASRTQTPSATATTGTPVASPTATARTATPPAAQPTPSPGTPAVSPTTAVPPTATAAASTSAKKGVGRGWGVGTPAQLQQLGVSWAYSWSLDPQAFNTTYQHVPMIWGKGYDWEAVARLALARPGSYWLIWNEPDNWQQAAISPEEAARVYRTVRALLKAVDPAAKLIVGGVADADVAWLESFRGEYRRLYDLWPEVEGWHVHNNMQGDYDPAEWRRRLQNVRTWMVGNGDQGELWLTEFGALDSRLNAARVMADQVLWLEAQPWITRYAWYATQASGPGCSQCTGSLLEPDWAGGGLTELGQLYRRLP